MKRKKLGCRAPDCALNPFLGGYCQVHFEEDQRREKRRDDAVTALHSGLVDGALPSGPELRAELDRLRVYWNRACQAVNTQRGTAAMPMDEAGYALKWCISLAQEIVEGQRAIAARKPLSHSFTMTREWVWENLCNLDAGLRSNGTPRK